MKVELIAVRGMGGETRFRLRVNGRAPRRIKEATLTEVFDPLRRWLVEQVCILCRVTDSAFDSTVASRTDYHHAASARFNRTADN
jgi:hypothetical protein